MLSLTYFLGCTTSGILINEELIITPKYASVFYHRKMMNELHTQKSWFKDVPKFYFVTITNIASFTIIILIIIIITGTLLRLWRCPSSPILGQTLSIVPCLSIAYTFIIIIIIISSTARCIFEYQQWHIWYMGCICRFIADMKGDTYTDWSVYLWNAT